MTLPKGVHRRWIATMWHIHDYEFSEEVEEKILHAEWQNEVGEKTEGAHTQMHIHFKQSVDAEQVQQWLSEGEGKYAGPPVAGKTKEDVMRDSHLEVPVASCLQNFKYCTKEKTRAPGSDANQIGTHRHCKKKGQRSDLDELKRDMLNGKRMEYIARRHTDKCIKYINNIEKTMRYLVPLDKKERYERTKIIVIYGGAGTGKSGKAKRMSKGSVKTYYKNARNNWWDGYDPTIHEDVIIQDFDGEDFSSSELKRLGDDDPLQVQVKGGHVDFNSKRVIITTQVHPKKWYPNKPDVWKAISHRIAKRGGDFIEMKRKNNEEDEDDDCTNIKPRVEEYSKKEIEDMEEEYRERERKSRIERKKEIEEVEECQIPDRELDTDEEDDEMLYNDNHGIGNMIKVDGKDDDENSWEDDFPEVPIGIGVDSKTEVAGNTATKVAPPPGIEPKVEIENKNITELEEKIRNCRKDIGNHNIKHSCTSRRECKELDELLIKLEEYDHKMACEYEKIQSNGIQIINNSRGKVDMAPLMLAVEKNTITMKRPARGRKGVK